MVSLPVQYRSLVWNNMLKRVVLEFDHHHAALLSTALHSRCYNTAFVVKVTPFRSCRHTKVQLTVKSDASHGGGMMSVAVDESGPEVDFNCVVRRLHVDILNKAKYRASVLNQHHSQWETLRVNYEHKLQLLNVSSYRV